MEDKTLSMKEVNEIEEKRIASLNEFGIDEESVIHQAREDDKNWDAYFNENITRGKADANFCKRDQWTAVERSEFARLFKVPMTFNMLNDPIKKAMAEFRENRPDLLIRALNGIADQEEIDLRQDLLRSIAYNSQNELVYQIAAESAFLTGFGAFELGIEYANPRSFYKEIRYKAITDATRTSFDPTALLPHKGDGNYVSRKYLMDLAQFEATYPYIQNPVSYIDPRTLVDLQYKTNNIVVLSDYYKKEWYPLIIYKLSNGMIVTKEEWEDMQKQFSQVKELAKESVIVRGMILETIPTILAERQTQDYYLMHYRLLQNQIIDFEEFPSKHLPIIFVDGDSCFIEGRQYTRSFIYDSKDAQRFLNYVGSETATEFKNRRREQWLVTPDNIKGREQMWRNPEAQLGALVAVADKNGMMPQKMPAWEISQSFLLQYQRAKQDIRELMGFSETEHLQGKDISGKARRERKLEGAMSTFVYRDNMNQAVAQGGRVCLDLLHYVYGDEDRVINITKSDGKTKPIIINQKMPDGTIKNEIKPGEFDIEIDAGPSYAVQKEMALEFLQQTITSIPESFPLVADLWAKNLDVQFMPQIAERLKTIVPENIIAKEEGLPPPPPKPNPQQELAKMQLMNEMKALEERSEELKIRQEKHELEKVELSLKAQELQQKLGSEKFRDAVNLHKSDLEYSAKMAKILADVKKHAAQREKKSD